jgi:hypothetical protein
MYGSNFGQDILPSGFQFICEWEKLVTITKLKSTERKAQIIQVSDSFFVTACKEIMAQQGKISCGHN